MRKIRDKQQIIIIGAGLAGLSTAYYLAKKSAGKKIIVLEREQRAGGHASGNNAGMIRQTVEDASLAALAVRGRKLLSQAGGLGIDCGYRQNGSILLADGRKGKEELARIQFLLKNENVRSFFVSRAHAAKKAHVLKEASFDEALFCPSDSLVNVNRLLKNFIRVLDKKGVQIMFGAELKHIERVGEGFEVTAGSKTYHADKIVNASGAWAAGVGKIAGARDIPFKAYERHLFIGEFSKGRAAGWPFVWHLSRGLYFRPWEGKRLLLSPCDKILLNLKNKRRQQNKSAVMAERQAQLLSKLRSFSKSLSGIKIKEGRSGLRTMAPDGRFVVGEDAALKNFYWVAGLGGHGVTTSFSVGEMAACLVLDRPYRRDLVSAFSPERFSKQRMSSECSQK